MVSVVHDCNNSGDVWRNGLVLAHLQELIRVRNVNEEGKVDLRRNSSAALVLGDVRIMCSQL